MAWRLTVENKVLAEWEGELTREEVVAKFNLKFHHGMLGHCPMTGKSDYEMARERPFRWQCNGYCKLEWIDKVTT